PRVILAPEGLGALPVLVQSFGLGGIQANTALFGWPEDRDRAEKSGFRKRLRDVRRLGLNVVVVSSDEQRWEKALSTPRDQRSIDVLWNDNDSGRLALLSAYLFTRTDDWSRARIRVVATTEHNSVEDVEADLAQLLLEARIPADVVALPTADRGALGATCRDTTLVLGTMRLREESTLGPADLDLYDLLEVLPLTAAVSAGEEFDLLAGPESGRHFTLVEAERSLDAARERHGALQKRSEKVAAELIQLQEAAKVNPSIADKVAELEETLNDLRRRVLKAEARVKAAQLEIAEISSEG
ncbi:MAG: hypothetical protein KJN71_00795, partial [Acidimicrobiia bacterium]|nr:hypothetical protein [Acidimicrobiia bacterium]